MPREREGTRTFLCVLEVRPGAGEPVDIPLKPDDVRRIENEVVIVSGTYAVTGFSNQVSERIESVFPPSQQNDVLHQVDGLVHLVEPSAVMRAETSGR